MYPQGLGAILRIARFKRRLTQEQVCEAIQVNLTTLDKIENDKGVNGKTIKMLIDFYDLNEKIDSHES